MSLNRPLTRTALPALPLTALLALTVSAGPALAQHGGTHADHQNVHQLHGVLSGGMPSPSNLFTVFAAAIHQLDLSEAQLQSLQEMHAGVAPLLKEANASTTALHEVLHESLSSGNFDEGAVRSAFAEDARRQEDLLVAVTRVFAGLDEVLTPDQLKLLHHVLSEHFGLAPHDQQPD